MSHRRRRPRWPESEGETAEDLRRRQRRLGRWMVVLAAAVAFFVVVSLFLSACGDIEGGAAQPATATGVSPSAVAATAPPAATAAPPREPAEPPVVSEPETTSTAAPAAPTERLRHPDPGSLPLVRAGHIVDGDTLDVIAGGVELRVRVFGIDTPERGDDCFAEARDRLAELAGEELRLRADERRRDRYGRELRYLYTPDGASIDATMVIEGLAWAWTDDGALRDELVALEEEARAAGAGCLWAD